MEAGLEPTTVKNQISDALKPLSYSIAGVKSKLYLAIEISI